jgi:hypothetical protein
LPGYALISDSENQSSSPHPLVRFFSDKCINEFQKVLHSIDWSAVCSEMDIDSSYNKFCEIISDAFNKCF